MEREKAHVDEPLKSAGVCGFRHIYPMYLEFHRVFSGGALSFPG
jgi:hypothetical protein